MNININDVISLPREVIAPFISSFPSSWRETPKKEDKARQVAQSFFTHWKDNRLSNFSFALKVGAVALLGGAGVSIYMISIPGIVLCGAGVTVCLIGQDVIRREQVVRCKKACLDLEDWLICFKAACQKIKQIILPGVDSKSQKVTLSDEASRDLLNIIDHDLPENKLEDLAKVLHAHHNSLFGEKRSIGEGYWSSYWIYSDLKDNFGRHRLNMFYNSPLKCLREYLQEHNEKPGIDMSGKISVGCTYLLKDLVGDGKSSELPHPILVKTHMMLLTGDSHASPQGRSSFANLIEQAEYWRENIAIFRSSLS